jgi:hypothetical protein
VVKDEQQNRPVDTALVNSGAYQRPLFRREGPGRIVFDSPLKRRGVDITYIVPVDRYLDIRTKLLSWMPVAQAYPNIQNRMAAHQPR